MSATDVFGKIREPGIVPVIAIDDPAAALPLADALLEGGLPIVEITFRTAAAKEAIRAIASERPNVLVGAGTVLSLDNLRAAREAGARFAVAPGLNPDTVQHARDMGLPFVPGVATPSEVEQALALGCSTLKFFPAELMGGVEMLNALSGPYGHTGVKFVPTGGVNPANLASYIGLRVVAAVGGTWLAKKEDLAAGKWSEISNRCKTAVQAVQQARASASGR